VNRLEIRTLIRKNLGETTAAFWTDTELNTWIDDACDDLAFRAKCIRTNTLVTPVVDTAEYTLSSLIPKLLSVLEVYYYQNATNWGKLKPTNRTDLDVEHPGWRSASSGTPTEYYWDREEDLFGLYVKPNSTNAVANYVKIYHTESHTDISSDSVVIDIPNNLQNAIIDFVVARGLDTRGWGDRANDMWQKYFSKIHDYQVERHREKEDEDIVMKSEY
jgi:hypothetical protein